MDKDRVSCGKCKHCNIVIVPDGAAMFCPYRGIVGYFVKECKDYDLECESAIKAVFEERAEAVEAWNRRAGNG